MPVLCSITYKDFHGKEGLFSLYIRDADAEAPFTNLLALLQAFTDASQCSIERVQLAIPVPVTSLVNNAPSNAGSYDRVNEQAILVFRTAAGLETKVSIPAPLDELFLSSGPTALQDVDTGSGEALGIIAAGVTVPVITTKAGGETTLRKGWRKGQPHS